MGRGGRTLRGGHLPGERCVQLRQWTHPVRRRRHHRRALGGCHTTQPSIFGATSLLQEPDRSLRPTAVRDCVLHLIQGDAMHVRSIFPLLLAGLALSAIAAPTGYTIVDLGASHRPEAIDTFGRIVGTSLRNGVPYRAEEWATNQW